MRSIGLKPWAIPLLVAAMVVPTVVVAVFSGEIILPLVAGFVLATLVILAAGRYGADENVERRRTHGIDP